MSSFCPGSQITEFLYKFLEVDHRHKIFMLFSAVIFVISDDITRSWQWYANSCIAFFILKHLKSQLIEKVDHMNMDAYKKNIIKAFFLVSSIWDYSP